MPVGTVARVHWLGKKRIAAETNSTYLMSIWSLPESARLEAQTLDKLAAAPWRASIQPPSPQLSATNNLLRPLLDDLVQEESYLEIRNATNRPSELALAIRLDPGRVGLWETNLAAVLESLTGIRPAPTQDGPGWQLQIASSSQQPASSIQPPASSLRLTRAGEWTIIGLTQSPVTNALLGDLATRIQRNRAPFAPSATNSWLEVDLDPRGVVGALACGWSLPEDLTRISVVITSEGKSVRTRGQLNFAKPLLIELEPWHIPTNLVYEPLVSFTAVRGIKPWLPLAKQWSGLQVDALPEQLYFWSKGGVPFLSYFAAPLPDASNQVYRLTDQLLQANPWVSSNAIGRFERPQKGNGVAWKDVPFMSPYLLSLSSSNGQFAFGGLFSNAGTNRAPAELYKAVLGPTNLVGYDWEMTGPRIEGWIDISQLLRVVFHKPQIPFDCGSWNWLKALQTRLGNSVTVVTWTRPDQLSFTRKSGIGFTAIELHLLADWLESPQFPHGLHTFLAKNPPPAKKSPPPAGGPATNVLAPPH